MVVVVEGKAGYRHCAQILSPVNDDVTTNRKETQKYGTSQFRVIRNVEAKTGFSFLVWISVWKGISTRYFVKPEKVDRSLATQFTV